jgi:hypothetical protein
MKKLSLLALLVVASFAFIGCQTTAAPTTAAPTTVAPTTVAPTTAVKEFKVDGDFTAFVAEVHTNGAQQVTMVTVTITNGVITGYKIDARQAVKTTDTKGTEDTADDTYTFTWNAQTKVELGFNYKMHYNTYRNSLTDPATATIEGYQVWLTANNKNEWHTQAALIEAYWLANGVAAMEYDATSKVISNVAGVTVKNSGYTALALEAIENARAGKFQAIKATGTDLYIASMIKAENGTISELKLDVRQLFTARTDKSKFEWNVATKQELGFMYKMHYNTYRNSLTDPATATQAGYEAWLTANNRLEWFQQANIITDYIMANGWNASYQAVPATSAGIGMSLDGVTPISATAGVTIKSQSYFDVLSYLFAKVA